MVASWTLQRVHMKLHVYFAVDTLCNETQNTFPIETCDQHNFDLARFVYVQVPPLIDCHVEERSFLTLPS
jgi:hypothetical protein